MDYWVGGFFLVQSVKWGGWVGKRKMYPLLPDHYWTAGHMCESYPDAWIFPWTKEGSSEGPFYRELLNLSVDDFNDLQKKYDKLFANDQYGFPNVFFDITAAYTCYAQYLSHLPNLKLLSIGLPDNYWPTFIEEASKPNIAIGKTGIYHKLLQREKLLPINGTSLGYDILGFDGGLVSVHFDPTYFEDLKVRMNSYSFIEDFDEANRVAEYVGQLNIDEIWCPWLVHEYALNN